ncbi:MAG: MerR family transcriptional regulator [Chromatiales bacterium]|jgi:DNA-binding transcriptional MerR regulator
MSSQTAAETYFKIGTVSRITGIPTDTIRMWERRYGAVEPHRSPSGTRVYTQEDVNRLTALKRLVDAGHSIGTVAALPTAQLDERLSIHGQVLRNTAPQAETGPVRALIAGASLAERIETAGGLEGVEILGVLADWRGQDWQIEGHPEVLILEEPTVYKETAPEVLRALRRSGAARGVVVYRFGSREAIAALDTAQLRSVRMPAGMAELRRACLPGDGTGAVAELLEGVSIGAIPARRFRSEELERIANASTRVACECPHHLVDLIQNIAAFEHYSAECESRSASDAALHAYLHATSAQARALLEEALARAAEIEGIEY